eukprot:5445818-Pleurochrysis_carterae.AAC.1
MLPSAPRNHPGLSLLCWRLQRHRARRKRSNAMTFARESKQLTVAIFSNDRRKAICCVSLR